MTSALEWLGEAIALTFLAWLVAFVVHQLAQQRRESRCMGCGRVLASPLDMRMHSFDCRPATGSQPTRCHPPRRVGALETSKSRHR